MYVFVFTYNYTQNTYYINTDIYYDYIYIIFIYYIYFYSELLLWSWTALYYICLVHMQNINFVKDAAESHSRWARATK